MDGMKYDRSTGQHTPGDVLGLFAQLRATTGNLEAKTKAGVKFKVRSAEDLIDMIREKANGLGLLIYPSEVEGQAHPIEDGTLASVKLTVVLQAVSDGSRIAIAGFGLGADNQDKAGGKAGTYAFKQALVQALLAGGKENAKALGVKDTDDDGEPIAGGVKKKTPGKPSVEAVRDFFEKAGTPEEYKAAVQALMQLAPEKQLTLKDATEAAKTRVRKNQGPPAESPQ